MNWLPVMTLPDGTAIEMPMPSSEDSGHSRVHGYRVRGSTGVTEFATLPEVLDHLLNPRRERVEQLGSAAAGRYDPRN